MSGAVAPADDAGARPGGDAPGHRLQADALAVALGGAPVLDAVDAGFDTGWTAIVGGNGAGKSTLLRALAGLLPPLSGRVRLDGEDLATMPLRRRAQRIAWLDQAGGISGDLTARQTVRLGRLPQRGLFEAPTAADEAAIDAAMAATGCTPWAHRRLQELSGGERQRVLLARALATEAPVLLLDEPTAHLDPPQQVALARLLRQLAASRVVVSVLHDLPLALRADRLLLLAGGRVAATGACDDPALHRALEAGFGDALRIGWRDGAAQVTPRWAD